MLAYKYPNGVEKVKLVRSSNYAYSVTNNMLLNGFLFLQVLIAVLFTLKNFATTVFTVGE